jgi:hypothetical protein
MDILNTSEIVEHIIEYLPRSCLMNISKVSKLFKRSIKKCEDQEIVAITGDLYSLLTMDYCAEIVLELAFRNNHHDMIEFILKKHDINIENDARISQAIGYSNNQKYMSFYSNHKQICVGACEAGRPIDKYYELSFDLIFTAYKYDNIHYINSFRNKWDRAYESTRVRGICASQCMDQILQILNLGVNFNVLQGLIEGGHFELFKQYHRGYSHFELSPLIKSNNYEFLEYLIINKIHTLRTHCLLLMINYRRTQMIKLVLSMNKEINNNKTILLSRAKELNFMVEYKLIEEYDLSQF